MSNPQRILNTAWLVLGVCAILFSSRAELALAQTRTAKGAIARATDEEEIAALRDAGVCG